VTPVDSQQEAGQRQTLQRKLSIPHPRAAPHPEHSSCCRCKLQSSACNMGLLVQSMVEIVKPSSSSHSHKLAAQVPVSFPTNLGKATAWHSTPQTQHKRHGSNCQHAHNCSSDKFTAVTHKRRHTAGQCLTSQQHLPRCHQYQGTPASVEAPGTQSGEERHTAHMEVSLVAAATPFPTTAVLRDQCSSVRPGQASCWSPLGSAERKDSPNRAVEPQQLAQPLDAPFTVVKSRSTRYA
jgi:hypothetical protein